MYYLYLIQSPKGRAGFGIAKNPQSRNRDYVAHCGDIVNFPYLYGGTIAHVKKIENVIKEQYVDNIWHIEDRPLEWLNTNISVDQLKDYVDTLIEERHYRVKLIAKNYNFTQDVFNDLLT
jgi:hypothetical protein